MADSVCQIKLESLSNIEQNNMDEYETKTLRRTYTDILIQLGIDEYIIDSEIQNYKFIHMSKDGNILFSSTRKK